jgi:hypothetical protein
MAEKIKEKMAQLRQEAEVAVERAEAAERKAKEVCQAMPSKHRPGHPGTHMSVVACGRRLCGSLAGTPRRDRRSCGRISSSTRSSRPTTRSGHDSVLYVHVYARMGKWSLWTAALST